MKQTTAFLSLALILALVFAGCGHLSGNHPLGVTGGGENGYGSPGGSTGGGFDDGGGLDGGLFGGWQHDIDQNEFEMMYFHPDGSFEWYYFVDFSMVDSDEGTYQTSGNTIIFSGGFGTVQYSISGDGNTATIHDGSETTVWNRIVGD